MPWIVKKEDISGASLATSMKIELRNIDGVGVLPQIMALADNLCGHSWIECPQFGSFPVSSLLPIAYLSDTNVIILWNNKRTKPLMWL